MHGAPTDAAFIVSSGRGVHEAIAAARDLRDVGDRRLPSSTCRRSTRICCCELCESGKVVCLAEQNNGYILQNLLKVRYRRGRGSAPGLAACSAINTLDRMGGRNSSIPERMKS